MTSRILTTKTPLTAEQETAREVIYDQVIDALDELYNGRTDEVTLTLDTPEFATLKEFATFTLPVEWDEAVYFNTPDGLSDYDIETRSSDLTIEWYDGEVVAYLA